MFARFDENPAMTLQVIKETKRYGRTHGQRENSIPPTNKVCGGYNKGYTFRLLDKLDSNQVRRSVCPDLGPNCLQRLSADAKSIH